MLFKTQILATALSSLLFAGAGQAATVTLEAEGTGLFAKGDTIVITAATGANTPELFGFQGDLAFDASLLTLTDVTVNPLFTIPIVDADFSPPVTVAAGTFTTIPAGANTLATFTFTAESDGAATVSFDNILINDPDNQIIFSGDLQTDVVIGEMSDEVVIPLPASVLFFVTGIAGMTVIGRRRGA